MSIEIKAPTFPESVQEGSIATWHKQPGDPVTRDELLVDIETDKVVLEVVAPADGTLTEVFKGEGDIVLSNEVLALVVAGEVTATAPVAVAAESLLMSVVLICSKSQVVAKTDGLPKKMSFLGRLRKQLRLPQRQSRLQYNLPQ